MKKLLVICGPTATGKTDLGIILSKKFNGEIISADSRQVYKEMDIITGKDIPENSELRTKNQELKIKNPQFTVGYRMKDGIPIWLVDIVAPDYQFNVGEYAQLGHKVIKNIKSRKKMPIIVGGTGLYINALLEPLSNIRIPPNMKLREKLNKFNVEKLQKELGKIDSKKLAVMNISDKNNPRRLIRAIEITKSQTRFVLARQTRFSKDKLFIGLTAAKDLIFKRIDERVEGRIKQGAVNELLRLIRNGFSLGLPSMSATGYKQLFNFIEGRESLIEAVNKWKLVENAYAKRQMTWFKKNKKIKWFDVGEKDYISKIEDLIRKWYNRN